MLKAIIFDMDGVLIDSHPVHRKAWRKFLATVGKEVSNEELDFILEGRRREEILHHFLGDLPESTIAQYGERKEQFFQDNFQDVQLIPGIRPFLDKLVGAGLRTAIATSASSYRTRKTLERLDLESNFSAVVTGDEVPSGKPNPAVYQLASQRMDIAPEHLLVMEDAACGVQAARAAGMACIGVSRNGSAAALRAAGAYEVIPDFVDLSMDKLLELWLRATADEPSLLSKSPPWDK
jgi:HAD superfamily hydrolase (TIGR01509 family)